VYFPIRVDVATSGLQACMKQLGELNANPGFMDHNDGSDHSYRMVIEDRYRRMASLRRTVRLTAVAQITYSLYRFLWRHIPLLTGEQYKIPSFFNVSQDGFVARYDKVSSLVRSLCLCSPFSHYFSYRPCCGPNGNGSPLRGNCAFFPI
jgi:hypothetical protein